MEYTELLVITISGLIGIVTVSIIMAPWITAGVFWYFDWVESKIRKWK